MIPLKMKVIKAAVAPNPIKRLDGSLSVIVDMTRMTAITPSMFFNDLDVAL